MRFATSFVALTTLVSLGAAQEISDYSTAEILNGTAFADIAQLAYDNAQSAASVKRASTCTLKNASIRQEFRAMTKANRKSYTDAVTCLQNLAPQRMTAAQAAQYPGVKSRYDEYIATHINYTLSIHFTADFLAWHRYFIHNYEQDLKNLCGYTGVLPYWDWSFDAAAPQKSEIFNGDAYSMGSNGQYIPGREPVYLHNQDVTVPPGSGGGCLYSGPFAKTTIHLGPLDTANQTSVANSFDYNPRCITRDLSNWFSSRFNTYYNVTTLVLNSPDIHHFQSIMQADGTYNPTGDFGVHGGGHFTPGATAIMSDFYASPNDPIFYLHHAQLDRLWTIWQNLDIKNRQNAIYGTSTLLNNPPSPNMTLTDMIPFGFVAKDVEFGTLMDTFSGPFCYFYL